MRWGSRNPTEKAPPDPRKTSLGKLGALVRIRSMTDRYTGYVDMVYELYSLGIRAMPLARIPYAFPKLINHLAFLALRANTFLIYI
jgi:hypothetical protein